MYASAVTAAAQGVEGVDSVRLERLTFVGDPARDASPPPAALHVSEMEIIRLDNDPVHPEDGYAIVWLEGGR